MLNVTPDSFSDGGNYLDASRAIERGLALVEDGAHLVDVGGESTRPGAEPVQEQDEIRRVLPVVSALAEQGIAVSIDTMKPVVAREAIAAGAKVVNDVTALRDPAMRAVCAETGVTACLMHMQGEPRTMQSSPTYTDVVSDVHKSLVESVRVAKEDGVRKVWIDPGIGFGKNLQHNLSLLRGINQFVATGLPVLVGVSRKSFIGRLVSDTDEPAPLERREEGTYTAGVWALSQGARILRVHNVAAQRRAWTMWEAIGRGIK
ncbi:MAG: dihydropteroate synthase [Fimbriimonadaceae bacterium]|nr:dihydropteroate synthase [Fimbriimonadaceae bacterium]